jgi:chemotaxis signal transduction protein
VVEAVRPGNIASLPGAPPHIRGCARVRDGVLAVLDLPSLLDSESERELKAQSIVILRATPRYPSFGLLVDELGDTPEIASSRIVPTPEVIRSQSMLIDKVVTPDSASGDNTILILLSVERLAASAQGMKPEQMSA